MLARKFRKSKQKRIDKKTHRVDSYRHRLWDASCKQQASKQENEQASQKDMRAKET